MSQASVITILEEYPKGLTSKEMSEKLKITTSSLMTSLRKIKKYKNVKTVGFKTKNKLGYYGWSYRYSLEVNKK